MKPEYEEKFRALRTTLVGTDPEVRKQIQLDPEDEWLLDAFEWRPSPLRSQLPGKIS